LKSIFGSVNGKLILLIESPKDLPSVGFSRQGSSFGSSCP